MTKPAQPAMTVVVQLVLRKGVEDLFVKNVPAVGSKEFAKWAFDHPAVHGVVILARHSEPAQYDYTQGNIIQNVVDYLSAALTREQRAAYGVAERPTQ